MPLSPGLEKFKIGKTNTMIFRDKYQDFQMFNKKKKTFKINLMAKSDKLMIYKVILSSFKPKPEDWEMFKKTLIIKELKSKNAENKSID